jgi:hypothetical protein
MGICLLRTESLVAGRLRQLGIFYGLIGLSKANLHYFHNVFDFHVALPVEVMHNSLVERSIERNVFDCIDFSLTEVNVIRCQILFHMVLVRCSRQWNHADLQGEAKHDLRRRAFSSL